ncbi:MAG: hypothetical protein QW744_07305, partial [Candidatus Bathyarchaeia archaeon]
EAYVIGGFSLKFFPVANCIIRNVADRASSKSEVAVNNLFTFNKRGYNTQWLVGFSFIYFSSCFIVEFCFAVFYCNS